MTMKPGGKWWNWFAGGAFEVSDLVVDVPPAPDAHLVCGVPECDMGYIEAQDERTTVIACDVHNARTTHDTVKKVPREQRVIRVQDTWRQHGTSKPPR